MPVQRSFHTSRPPSEEEVLGPLPYETRDWRPDGGAAGSLWFGAVVTAVSCGLLWLACHSYFKQAFFDDSFITLRYVRNLVEGHGLVWNAGERPVEGFTNLLWILLLALFRTADPIRLVGIAKYTGVALGMGTLWLSWLAARSLLPTGWRWLAGIVPLHLTLSPVFCRHAISGMETMLTCFLFAGLVLLWCVEERKKQSPAYWLCLAFVTFLATLTRPDALLFGVTGTAALAWGRRDFGARGMPGLRYYGIALGALLAAFVLWKYRCFGALIPLPAYLKCRPDLAYTSAGRIRDVMHHWLGFVGLAAPLLLIGAEALVSGRLPRPKVLAPVAAAIGVYGLYFLSVLPVMSIHWRYLFPLYAPLAIVAVGCLAAMAAAPDYAPAVPRIGQRVAWLGLCLLFVGYNLGTFLEIRASSQEMYQDHVKYGALGTTLARFSGISVAVSEVGQLPYYAGCRVLDLCGLNDPFIARNRYKDPHFTQRFGEYLERDFGLPDIYVEPPEEYDYAALPRHPEIARGYTRTEFWRMRVYVLNRSRFRETILAQLRALAAGKPADPLAPGEPTVSPSIAHSPQAQVVPGDGT